MRRLPVLALLLGTSPDAFAGAVYNVTPTSDLVTLMAKLNPGDEIIFSESGTYSVKGSINVMAAGTEDEPVRIYADPALEGDPVIEVSDSWTALFIHDSTWVEVEGITISGAPGWDSGKENFEGIRIENSTGVTIQDCTVTNLPSHGIRLNGIVDQATIQRNHVHNIWGHGIYLGCTDSSCDTSNSLVYNNWVHDLGSWVLKDGNARLGIYAGPLSSNNRIQHNVVYRVGDEGIHVDSTQGSDENYVEANAVWTIAHPDSTAVGIYTRGASVVRNNVVFDIDGYGIISDEGDSGIMEKVRITHNTVVDTLDAGIRISEWSGKTGMSLANNVIANPLSIALEFRGDKAFDIIDDSNYISSNVVTGAIERPDDLDIEAMVSAGEIVPGGGYTDFLDVEGWDFYPLISDNSPLVDQGDPSSEAWVPETDFNGFQREGDEPDIGALEFFYESDEANPGWVISEGFKQIGEQVEEETPTTTGGGCCNKDGSQGGLLLLPLSLLAWGLRRERDV